MVRLFFIAVLIVLALGLAVVALGVAGYAATTAVGKVGMAQSFRKLAFAALIVVMFGVCTGWLGGL